MSKNYQNKDWLYEKHVVEGLTNIEISNICDVSDSTICRWKNKLDIPSNGHTVPDRVRDKIAQSVSAHLEENGHPFEGETHSDESLRKMSEASSGENNHFFGESRPEFAEKMRGENNPSWKGGVTDTYDFRKSNKWQNFSEQKKESVSWTCENCGNHGSEHSLHTHHADPVSDGGNRYDNTFIVLCEGCHKGDYDFWHTEDVDTQLKQVSR